MRKIVLFATLVILGMFSYNQGLAAVASHAVISQIQIDSIAGVGGTADDFVELHNPTANAIDLENWSIQKTSKTGGSLYRKKLTGTIPAYGYFLIVRGHADTIQSLKDLADVLAAGSSFSLSDDNTIYLVQNNEDVTGSGDPDIVDMVGMGAAETFEGTAAENPADSGSIERAPGGGEGNGEDTDNNSSDFFQQATPHPRNSQSTPEQPPASEGNEESIEEEVVSPTPSPVSSSGFALEISEIMPNPEGADSGQEWVELYNAGSNSTDLSGWFVDDEGDLDVPGGSAYEIPAGTILSGLEYLAIEIPKGQFALNNSQGDTVRLFDSEENLRLGKTYPGPAKSGFAYAVDKQGQWQWTDTPTPGSENVFAEVKAYINTLRISEVLPNPVGDDTEGEFIELYNYGSDSVDLSGWIVADNRGRYTIKENDFFDTEIESEGYFVLYREVSGIALNNSGAEEVSIFNPDDELVHRITFDAKGTNGESYADTGNEVYQWTATPTPGAKNKIILIGGDAEGNDAAVDPDPVNETSILPVELEDVKILPLGSMVNTSGVVIVEPGLLDANVVYLAGSGIRVSFADLPEFELIPGMEIEFTGELSSFHNELQLKVSNVEQIKILGSVDPITPHDILSGEVGETVEGFLVSVRGIIARSSGDTFFVDDGSGEARILIKESTGIEKPKMKKGDEVVVTGIVSQFNDNYRILPRYNSDIVVAGIQGESISALPRTGGNLGLVLALSFWFCYIMFVFFTINKKETNNEPRNTTLSYSRGHDTIIK